MQSRDKEIKRQRRVYHTNRRTTCLPDIPSFSIKLIKTPWIILRWIHELKKRTNTVAQIYHWDTFTFIDRCPAICRDIPWIRVSSPLFRRFAVGRALIKSKLVPVPILILNPLVTVFYGSVLAYKVFQESFFPILGFFNFGLRSRHWYSWCKSEGPALNLPVCDG